MLSSGSTCGHAQAEGVGVLWVRVGDGELMQAFRTQAHIVRGVGWDVDTIGGAKATRQDARRLSTSNTSKGKAGRGQQKVSYRYTALSSNYDAKKSEPKAT